MEAHQYMVKLAFEAMKVTAVLNQGYHEPEEIFVITKLYPNQFANAEEAVDEALDKLDIEYIDMMLLHHPGDHDVEAYQAMEQAVEEGKISKSRHGSYCAMYQEVKDVKEWELK